VAAQKRESKRRKTSSAKRPRRVKGKAARVKARWRPASVAAAILVTAAVALTAVLAAFIARDSASGRFPAPQAARPAGAARAPSSPDALPEGGGASINPTPTRTSADRRESRSAERPQGEQPPARAYLGSLILVIDDVGYNLKELEAFLELPFPLTIAVLPGLQYSEEAARAARKAGKEVILHQPMQAQGGQNPGPGAILLSMSREEAIAVIEANLLTVPGVVGINNHMGSAASADLYLMEAVAEVAKNRGIYYLDSLTVLGTAMPEAARREGIRYWERDVFLDNTPDRASIIRAVEDGKKRASKDRPAVMIGHVWSAELAQALSDLYPKLVEEGYSLSTISRFMLQEAIGDDDSPGD
jgi:polysaccharide deacetylase 2 family uncharacterized protein YibQ